MTQLSIQNDIHMQKEDTLRK